MTRKIANTVEGQTGDEYKFPNDIVAVGINTWTDDANEIPDDDELDEMVENERHKWTAMMFLGWVALIWTLPATVARHVIR